jgi:hypothetical protein
MKAMPSTSGSRPSAPARSLRDETNVTRCEQVNLLDNLLQGNLEVVWMSRSLQTARSSMALRRTQSCTPSATPSAHTTSTTDFNMLIGPAPDADLLEIGVVNGSEGPVIVHAMRARPRFLDKG